MDAPGTIRDLIREAALRDPGAPAFIAPGRAAMTYGQLDEVVAKLIGSLSSLGFPEGGRLAAALPNGPEMAVAFLAAACAGACAPLNPAYSVEEFEFYLRDLRASALLTSDGASQSAVVAAARLGLPVLTIETRPSSPAGEFAITGAGRSARASAPEVHSSGVALLLHTSGTTSRPKLVPLTHSNLCASAEAIQRTLALTPADCCLNMMPLFHIHALAACLLASLRAGASVICTPGFHASRFFAWLRQFSPTWYSAAPAMHQAILARARRLPREGLPARLRFVRSCSAPLPPSVMTELEDLFEAPAIEAYGMTEAAHQMASNPLPPAVRKPGSVGLPAGPEIAVMGEDGALLAPGETGEVVIRGGQVTSGYEANPEANRQAFRDGWFRTGDQGRLDPDGYLFLTGRLKELINRGGEKISPREVDEVILQHPAVRQAVAFAVPHAQLGEDVGAAIVLKEGASATAGEIREFVAARLAPFKAPCVVRFVPEIPKGPTGKVQRIGLAAKLGVEVVGRPPRPSAGPCVAPRDELEALLAAIWREVLSLDEVGVDDEFSSLGGTSLQLSEAMSRLRDSGTVTPPLAHLPDDPTVAQTAAAIRSWQERAGAQAARLEEGLTLLKAGGGRTPLFCAPGHNASIVGLARLARHLDPGRSIYAVELPFARQTMRLEDMARQVAAAIRRTQPHGPYQLLGSCFGGYLVYEAACLFAEAGEQVSLLCLVNSHNPPGAFSRRPFAHLAGIAPRLARASVYHWRSLMSRPPGQKASFIKERLAAFLDSDLRLVAARLSGSRRLKKGEASGTAQRELRRLAAARWKPRRFPGEIVQFTDGRPRRGLASSSQLGWEGLTATREPALRLPNLDGATWAEENAAFIAERLERHFEADSGA